MRMADTHTATKSSSRKRSAPASSNNGATALSEQVEILKDDVAKLASAAGVTAKHQFDPVADYITKEPLKAVLVAAGVGCVLGFLFSRR